MTAKIKVDFSERVTGKPTERLGGGIEWKDKLDSGGEKASRRTGVQREIERERMKNGVK